MTETLFLQFYNRTKGGYWDLGNGFSDTYDLCREKGDFLWQQHETDIASWYVEETYAGRDLPIRRGTVYISAVYLNHLFQACVWAHEHPQVQFVVGGPVAAEQRSEGGGWNPLYFRIDAAALLPKNLTITGRSVENWFDRPEFSGRWRLDVPDAVPSADRIYFSYTLDNHCYWHRCIYCNIACHAPELFRARSSMNFDFKALRHRGPRIVRLNTGSLSPTQILNVLPALPSGAGLEYRVFMRAARAENQALEKILASDGFKLPPLTIGIGLEFPTDRMLRFAGKGTSQEEVLETLQICRRHRIRVNGNFILGWGNLQEQDLSRLEHFMESLPHAALSTIQVRWLFAHPHTRIHDTYRGHELRLGPFYAGFRVQIDERALALNRRAADILAQYAENKGYRVEGLAGIYRDHFGVGSSET